ncbi:MAG TPA: cyclase family protein [Bacteroidales bacterium]|nr:cyclase family protein [Bacteroidales bacterium]
MAVLATFAGNNPCPMPIHLIDLTRTMHGGMPVYPGSASPVFETIAAVGSDGYRETSLRILSHHGTHIDAPAHILANGKTLDLFPPEKFAGKAIVISVAGETAIDRSLLQRHEARIAGCDFILFYTGWQHRWGTAGYLEDCPLPTREAAEWLAKFPLKGIGADAFSLDSITAWPIREDTLPNHFTFLRNEILLIENLDNLDQLPGTEFELFCLPLRIAGIDGSPVRAMAVMK